MLKPELDDRALAGFIRGLASKREVPYAIWWDPLIHKLLDDRKKARGLPRTGRSQDDGHLNDVLLCSGRKVELLILDDIEE